MTMRAIRNVSFVGLVLAAAFVFESRTSASFECNPDPHQNDCGGGFCNPYTGECTNDCNQNPEQCTSQWGMFCMPSGDCVYIG